MTGTLKNSWPVLLDDSQTYGLMFFFFFLFFDFTNVFALALCLSICGLCSTVDVFFLVMHGLFA